MTPQEVESHIAQFERLPPEWNLLIDRWIDDATAKLRDQIHSPAHLRRVGHLVSMSAWARVAVRDTTWVNTLARRPIVYLRRELLTGQTAQMAVICHEFTHVAQRARDGWFAMVGNAIAGCYHRVASRRWHAAAFEREALDVQNQIVTDHPQADAFADPPDGG